MVKRTLLCLLALMLVWTCFVAYAEENTQVSHYLLLGEDGYAEEVVEDARTDTIVLVSLDTRYNRVIMTSILRDCQINNPRGNPTKDVYKRQSLTYEAEICNAGTAPKDAVSYTHLDVYKRQSAGRMKTTTAWSWRKPRRAACEPALAPREIKRRTAWRAGFALPGEQTAKNRLEKADWKRRKKVFQWK